MIIIIIGWPRRSAALALAVPVSRVTVTSLRLTSRGRRGAGSARLDPSRSAPPRRRFHLVVSPLALRRAPDRGLAPAGPGDRRRSPQSPASWCQWAVGRRAAAARRAANSRTVACAQNCRGTSPEETLLLPHGDPLPLTRMPVGSSRPGTVKRRRRRCGSYRPSGLSRSAAGGSSPS